MSGAAASHWRGAWFAVWSPFVAWALAVSVLAAAGGLGFDPRTIGFVAGPVLGLCAFGGLFVAVGRATDSLLSTLTAGAASREQARLSLLSLFGVLVSLIGYGGLVVLCGLVVLMSPFHGVRH